MPRSRLVWLEIADQQYRELSDATRALVDRGLVQLVENPTADPDADYGLLFYAVVRDPPTVIVLRLVSFA